MTTILGIQYAKGFVIVADYQVTDNDRPYQNDNVKKIVEVGDYVIAGAGNARFCDSIQYAWTPPEYDGTEMFRFMVGQFVPSMRKAHEDAGCLIKDDEVFKFIVGLNNTLFYISEDYSVLMDSTPYYGAGTGAQYAIGALAYGASIKDAMKIANKYDINTGSKIQIVKRGKQNG